MKISLCQINIQAGNIQHNHAIARLALIEAVQQGGHLAILPELWSSGYDLSKAILQSRSSPEILADLTDLSNQYKISIGGSLLEQATNQLFNTFTLLRPDTQPVSYQKTHLFRLVDEHRWLSPGHRTVMTDLGDFKVGLSICYDLRFPELYRGYALSGVNLFLICAEWPTRRIEHWNTLLRARAIENQSFVVAVNTVGISGSATYGGSSVVISPWGETILQASATEEEIITCDIDPLQLTNVRTHLPVFSDRRPEVYEFPPAER
jgi:predicted amidohydrolase